MFLQIKATFIFFCLFGGLPLLAANEAVNGNMTIDWQPMSINDGFARSRLDPSPYPNHQTSLGQQEWLWVLLPAQHALNIKLEAVDGSNEQQTDKPYMRLLVSETPGAAIVAEVKQMQLMLAPKRRDRVIQLHNLFYDNIELTLHSGQIHKLQAFPPLTWIEPENAKPLRIARSNHSYHNYYSDQEDTYIPIEANQDYWLESGFETSLQWQAPRHQYWYHPGKDGASLTHRGTILFEQSSHSELFLYHDSNLRGMVPGVFSLGKTQNLHMNSPGNSFFRVQNLKTDWLFESNYQEFSLPKVQQLRQIGQFQQGFTAQLTDKALPTTASGITGKLAGDVISHSTPVLPYNGDYTPILNRWMRYKTMAAASSKGINQTYVRTQDKAWFFPGYARKDLSRNQVQVPSLMQKSAFLTLVPGQEATYPQPLDIGSNQVQLDVHFVRSTGGIGALDILVDGQPFQTIQQLSNPDLAHLTTTTNWQLENAVEEAPPAKQTARINLQLPAGWQAIKVKASGTTALMRMRYQTLRTPKLDGSQWQAWLDQGRKQAGGQAALAQHPHWLEYVRYIEIKQQQFTAVKHADFWQSLIQVGSVSGEFFDLPIPASLAELQLIQSHLLNPKPNQWQYWLSLTDALQREGWENFQTSMLRSLVLLHQDETIVTQAIARLMGLYEQSGNRAAQLALISAVSHGKQFPASLREQCKITLAELLLMQNRPDYALFALSGASPSEQQKSLQDLAMQRLGVATQSGENPTRPLGSVKINQAPHFQHQITSQQSFDIRNLELGVSQRNYLVGPGAPVRISVGQGAQLRVTARQWFSNEADIQSSLHDWLYLTYQGHNGQKPVLQQQVQLPIFNSDYRSSNLAHAKGSVGAGHSAAIQVPEPGVLELASANTSLVVNIQEQVVGQQIQWQTTQCSRDNTQVYMAKWWQFKQSDTAKCEFKTIKPNNGPKFAVTPYYMPALTEQMAQTLSALHEHERSPGKASLATLNQTIQSWPGSRFKQRLLRRLNQYSKWQALTYPLQAKKFTFFSANTNQPLSPEAYRNRLLYQNYYQDWEKLSSQRNLNYDILVQPQQQFRLLLHSQQHLFLQQAHSQVEIFVNDQKQQSTILQMGQSLQLPLAFTSGQQRLKIKMHNIEGQASILAKLQFTDGTKDWQEQPQQVRLRLFQADAQEPYQVFLPEDSWLRIDSFNGSGLVGHQYRFANQGLFSWYPEQSADLGYRLYKLTLPGSADAGEPKERQHIAATSKPMPQLEGNNTAPWQVTNAPQLQPTAADTASSWGLGLTMRQLRNPDEDTAQNNRFTQISGYYQDADVLRRYFMRYGLAVRDYDSSFKTSYHGNLEWWDSQWLRHFDLNLGLSIASQKGYLHGEHAWSARTHANLYWQYAIDRRYFNRLGVSAFYHVIGSGKDPIQYANSVYSQYKLDHRHGIKLTDSMQYRWHHDLQSWFNLSLTSNPLGQSSWLDNSVAEIGTRVFYQGLSADIAWRWQHFNSDEDRNRSRDAHRLGLGLEWFTWDKQQHYRFRAGVDRNFEFDENYWYLGISYNRSGNRGVRDYLPQSMAFPALRQQQALLDATLSKPLTGRQP